MRCIAHISDLHFGTEDPEMTASLFRQIRDEEPSLLIVSGDLTQRARPSQFKAAAEFLEQFDMPKVVVPGNHDVPLYDLVRRFAAPLRRFQKYIQRELNPYYEDNELSVLGLNTARSFTRKSGRISHDQIQWITETLQRVPAEKFKILVTHHPFIPPPGEPEAGIDLVGRAHEALVAIDAAGIDLMLAGHLHHGYSGDVRTYYPATKRSIIVVQAGTAISHRVRNEPNAYNLLRLDRSNIQVEVRVWHKDGFLQTGEYQYKLVGSEWRLARGQANEDLRSRQRRQPRRAGPGA